MLTHSLQHELEAHHKAVDMLEEQRASLRAELQTLTGTQFTCITGTKVQILKRLRRQNRTHSSSSAHRRYTKRCSVSQVLTLLSLLAC